MVLTSVIMDIYAFIIFLLIMVCGTTFGFLVLETDEELGKMILKITGIFDLLFFLEMVLLIIKIYYGLTWFCAGRTR